MVLVFTEMNSMSENVGCRMFSVGISLRTAMNTPSLSLSVLVGSSFFLNMVLVSQGFFRG